MKDEPDPERKQKGILAEFLTIGLTFPAAVLVGYFGGSWFDRQMGTAPFGLLGGILAGLGAALIPVFRLNSAWERIEQQKRKRDASNSPGTPRDHSSSEPPGSDR